MRKKITIAVDRTSKLPKRSVDAAVVCGLLAINRAIYEGGAPIPKTWVVTHVPTGWCILQGLSYAGAKAAIRELNKTDWPDTSDPKRIKRDPSLHRAFLNASALANRNGWRAK